MGTSQSDHRIPRSRDYMVYSVLSYVQFDSHCFLELTLDASPITSMHHGKLSEEVTVVLLPPTIFLRDNYPMLASLTGT